MARSQHAHAAVGFALAAGVVSLIAGFGVVRIVGHYEALDRPAHHADRDLIPVVMAKHTLVQGVAIQLDDLYVRHMPREALPQVNAEVAATRGSGEAGVFPQRAMLVGQVPSERILMDEPIRARRLADGAAGVGLNAVIPTGMRAMSVGLAGADAVTGFLTPGSYVDVLVTQRDPFGFMRTSTVLQALYVVAVNARRKGPSNTPTESPSLGPSVTFLVTPGQAEDFAFADALGDVSLTLRNQHDFDARVGLTGASLNDLIRRVPPAEPLPKPTTSWAASERESGAAVTTILVVRGSFSEEVPAEQAPVLPGEGHR